MGSKGKGSRTERELVHLFNDTGSWAAIRIAGSGLTKDPNPDVLAGNKQRYLAIECKSLKANNKYLEAEEIKQIIEFSSRFGAEPWIGMRFNNLGWLFLKPKHLIKTKSNYYSVSLLLAKEKGLSFEQLINKQDGNNLL